MYPTCLIIFSSVQFDNRGGATDEDVLADAVDEHVADAVEQVDNRGGATDEDVLADAVRPSGRRVSARESQRRKAYRPMLESVRPSGRLVSARD